MCYIAVIDVSGRSLSSDSTSYEVMTSKLHKQLKKFRHFKKVKQGEKKNKKNIEIKFNGKDRIQPFSISVTLQFFIYTQQEDGNENHKIRDHPIGEQKENESEA